MGRVERSRDINRDRTMLERIVMLLLALAALADRAAGRSAPKRREALDFLAYGEAEARGLIVAMATCPESGPESGTESDNAPDEITIPDWGPDGGPDSCAEAGDASLLAARLRALALVLYAMLSAARALPDRIVRHMSPLRHTPAGSASGWRNLPAPPPDTS